MQFFRVRPKILVFFVTFKCNSRCIMCHAWQKQNDSKDMSLEQIERVFSERSLNSDLAFINLTGGEPTLRQDLVEIVRTLLRHCPNLKRIDIPSNGIDSSLILDKTEQILSLLLPTDVTLSVTVSVDGIGEVQERVRKVKGIFNNIETTLKGLKELESLYPNLSLGINTVVTKINYRFLDQVRDYASRNNLGINFTLGAISEIGVESIAMRDGFCLNREERKEILPFFEQLVKGGGISPVYGNFIIDFLKGRKRKQDCVFKKGRAFLLEPNGDTYMCGNFKCFKLGNIRDYGFAMISKNRKKIPKQLCKKCLTCESNCYLE